MIEEAHREHIRSGDFSLYFVCLVYPKVYSLCSSFPRASLADTAYNLIETPYTMSLTNKLAITDVDLKDKRVLIRVRCAETASMS